MGVCTFAYVCVSVQYVKIVHTLERKTTVADTEINPLCILNLLPPPPYPQNFVPVCFPCKILCSCIVTYVCVSPAVSYNFAVDQYHPYKSWQGMRPHSWTGPVDESFPLGQYHKVVIFAQPLMIDGPRCEQKALSVLDGPCCKQKA